MPKVESKRPKAYTRGKIAKPFAVMTPDEYLRCRFFLVTGCREQEVQYATWDHLDLNKGTYYITGEGKADCRRGPLRKRRALLHRHGRHGIVPFLNGLAKTPIIRFREHRIAPTTKKYLGKRWIKRHSRGLALSSESLPLTMIRLPRP